MCRPQLAAPSIPQRAICPNCRAHASSARCPSPETRKCSEASDPAARINDRRGQRPLVRIDPDHIASVIGREQQVRRSRTALLRCSHCSTLTSSAYVVEADRPTTSRWAPLTVGRTLLSSQADPRRQEPRPTLRPQDTLAGESDRFRVRPRFSLRPYANRRPRGHQGFNTGSAFVLATGAGPRRCFRQYGGPALVCRR